MVNYSVDWMHSGRPLSVPSPFDPIHGVLDAAEPPSATCTAELALQHVFAITTLESSRNANLRHQCTQAGLRCRYVPAVRANELAVMRLREAVFKQVSRFKRALWWTHPLNNGTAGEFALALSHRNVFDAVILEQLPCAIVLENDAVLAPGFVPRLLSLQLPAVFDLGKLEGCMWRDPAQELAGYLSVASDPVRLGEGERSWCIKPPLATPLSYTP
jgi:hypothetical protein